MTTTFTYLKKEYQVDIDPAEWYDTDSRVNTIIKLPNGELLAISNWAAANIQPKLVPVEHLYLVLEANEVDQEELAFQSLLKQYNLTDSPKTRKFWYKCYEHGHSSGLEEQINWFHELVDLIKED